MRTPGLIASATFAVLTLASAIALSFRRAESDAEAWVSIAIPVLVIAGVILVANLAAGVWATRARDRATRLAADLAESIVVESGRLGGLQKFLTSDGALDPVAYITATFDRDGAQFWRDYSPPRVWRQIRADDLRGVSVENFLQDGRVRLRLRLNTSEGDVTVPVLGHGLVRMMSPDQTEAESIAERVARLFRWERAGDGVWRPSRT